MSTPTSTPLDPRLLELLEQLVHLPLKRGGLERMLSTGRRLARRLDLPCNPLGASTSKLGLAGTYRPVGATCPSSCPLLDQGCYAQQGQVGMQQRRASEELLASLTSAAIVMTCSARYKQVARLHVSGDFYTPSGVLDYPYLCGLINLSTWLEQALARASSTPLAYTYTHGQDLGVWTLMLRQAGIVVRHSGMPGHGGCIVEPFETLPALRNAYPELTFARCRAQLDEITQCRDCKLCWEREELTIVFAPHGSQKRKVIPFSDRV